MSSDRDQDHVDHILDQWSMQRPDLDVSPMGIIGRISRLSHFLEHSIAEVLARHELNEPQFAVLAALRRARPPRGPGRPAPPPPAPVRGPRPPNPLPQPVAGRQAHRALSRSPPPAPRSRAMLPSDTARSTP